MSCERCVELERELDRKVGEWVRVSAIRQKAIRDANRGAEANALINRSLATKLVGVEAERDTLKAQLERAKEFARILSGNSECLSGEQLGAKPGWRFEIVWHRYVLEGRK